MKHTVVVNGEKFEINLTGLKHGDEVKGVGEQCEGCGYALDAEASALVHGANRSAIRCSQCGMVYPVAKREV